MRWGRLWGAEGVGPPNPPILGDFELGEMGDRLGPSLGGGFLSSVGC
jgi:hypothetical protein